MMTSFFLNFREVTEKGFSIDFYSPFIGTKDKNSNTVANEMKYYNYYKICKINWFSF